MCALLPAPGERSCFPGSQRQAGASCTPAGGLGKPSEEPRRLPRARENLHLNVSALGHRRVSCYSTRRKEEPLGPERVQSARACEQHESQAAAGISRHLKPKVTRLI